MSNDDTILDLSLSNGPFDYISEEIFQKHIFPKNIWSPRDLESHIKGLICIHEIEIERIGRIDKSNIDENTLLDLQKSKKEIEILEDLLYHFKMEEDYLHKGGESASSERIEEFPNLYQIHYKILQHQKESFKTFKQKINQQEVKNKL